MKYLALIPLFFITMLCACSTQQFTEQLLGIDCLENSGAPDCDDVDESLYDRTPRAGIPDVHSNEALENMAEKMRD